MTIKFKKFKIETPVVKPPEANGWIQLETGYWKLRETWTQPLLKMQEVEHEFEMQVFLNLIHSINKEELTFWELGAAIGDWCLEIAGILDFQLIKCKPKTYRFLALEPATIYLNWAREHLNKQKIKTTLIKGAILDRDGECPFLEARGGQYVTSRGNVVVPCFTIDTLMETCNFPTVDIVHMDVQGSELWAVNGAKKAIKNGTIRYFSIRSHSAQLHEEIKDFFKNTNYKLIIDYPFRGGEMETPLGKIDLEKRADGILFFERSE